MSKVADPSLIAKRVQARGNVWNWVQRINQELNVGYIKPDYSIDIWIEGGTPLDIYSALVEIYEGEGWELTRIVETSGDTINLKDPNYQPVVNIRTF